MYKRHAVTNECLTDMIVNSITHPPSVSTAVQVWN